MLKSAQPDKIKIPASAIAEDVCALATELEWFI